MIALDIKISQRKVPRLDEVKQNKRRKKRIKTVLAVEDNALSQFGAMSKQANKK